MTPDARLDHSGLRALFVNCTLKRSPELSHTEGLMRRSMALMEAQGVDVDLVRLVDHDIAPGVYPDMRERGGIPAVGNVSSAWNEGERWGYDANPEYR